MVGDARREPLTISRASRKKMPLWWPDGEVSVVQQVMLLRQFVLKFLNSPLATAVVAVANAALASWRGQCLDPETLGKLLNDSVISRMKQ